MDKVQLGEDMSACLCQDPRERLPNPEIPEIQSNATESRLSSTYILYRGITEGSGADVSDLRPQSRLFDLALLKSSLIMTRLALEKSNIALKVHFDKDVMITCN